MDGIQTYWVLSPVAQQANGTWIDGVLQQRLGEFPLPGKPANVNHFTRARVEVFREADPEQAVNAAFYERGWTDGLPIVAPTQGRVRAMLAYSTISQGETLGEMEPLRGLITAEKLAVNAVMAGCRPEYFPIILAATRAIISEAFNLRGTQTTDENVAPLLIVSGPIAAQLGFNAGLGALGPGWQANASVGRCLRLIMINIGGGYLGVVSLAGIGQPARYSLCVAEQQVENWSTLQIDAGHDWHQSSVTLMRAESVINITGGLDDIASVMGSAVSIFSMLHGGTVAVLLSPHTARLLIAQGWNKSDVSKYLHENGRIPVAQWRKTWVRREIVNSYGVPPWVAHAELEPQGLMPVVESPDHIVVFVAGGDAPIAQHAYFPTWGFPPCKTTEVITWPKDLPIPNI